mgnify:CR=1 FL=1
MAKRQSPLEDLVIMKILITGADGYIGSVLASKMIEEGYDVVGLDTGFYKSGQLYNGFGKQLEILRKDTRDVTEDDLRGFDAVIHLAELSNDPLSEINPDLTYSINYHGSVSLAEKCRKAGVKRFIYSSSCSVYGVAKDDLVTEESPVNPQTAYAKCKILVEKEVSKLADDNFSPVFLRNATAYGPSPRMRFDIVLNNLSGLAWVDKEIRLNSDGTPWRPLVHVLDICQAMICAAKAPKEIIHNQVFNVGSNEGNYQVRDIAKVISEVFPNCKITMGQAGSDNRSYRVNFDKIYSKLPGFKCQWSIKDGAEQLKQIFEKISMTKKVFESNSFTRLKEIKYLMGTGQLDNMLNWKVKK